MRIMYSNFSREQESNYSTCTVTIDNEVFESVRFKTKPDLSDKCSHYEQHCGKCSHIVRTFDCDKNLNKIIILYQVITTIIFIFVLGKLFFNNWQGGFNFTLKNLGICILFAIIFDITCSFFERFVNFIYDYSFLYKLRKSKKLEQEKQERENERINSSPHYQDIVKAENIIDNLAHLVHDYDFGKNTEKINLCIEKLREILVVLKQDNSGFERVSFVFNQLLPEFYGNLELYSFLVKSDSLDDESEALLTSHINLVSEILNGQKAEAMFDVDYIKVHLNSSIKAFENLVKMNGGIK